MFVILGLSTLSKCYFLNDVLSFITHGDNEKDVEMGCDQQYAWLRVKTNIKPLLLSVFDCWIHILSVYPISKGWNWDFRCAHGRFILNEKDEGCRYLDIRAQQSEIEGKAVKWMVKSQFSFLSLIPAFQRWRSSSLVVWLPLKHVTMLKSTPTPLLIRTFPLFTTCENALVSSKPA